MELEGKIWKEGRMWLVEIPGLDAMTQGKTREDALLMAEDLVFEMMHSYFKSEVGKDFKVTIFDYKRDTIGITTNETKLLLSLRRQREKTWDYSETGEKAGGLGRGEVPRLSSSS